MRHLFSGTALVLIAALTAHADNGQETQIFAAPDDEQTRAADGAMQIHAADLVGHPVHLPGAAADKPIAPAYSEAPPGWERAGKIRDVILDSDGQIRSVVLDVSGFLGMGERQIDTRLDALKFARDSDDEGGFFIVYTGGKRMLEDERDYDREALEAEGGLSLSEAMVAERRAEEAMTALERGSAEARNTYSDATVTIADKPDPERERTMGAVDNRSVESIQRAEAEDEDGAADGAALDVPARPGLEGVAENAITAGDLDGLPVRDVNGKDVGEVSEILMTEDGQIERVVIDLGGFMGMGEKPVALPFDALLFEEEEGTSAPSVVNLGFSQSELEEMDAWKG